MTKAKAQAMAEQHARDIVSAAQGSVDPQGPPTSHFGPCDAPDGSFERGPYFELTRDESIDVPADGALAAFARIKSAMAAQGVRFTADIAEDNTGQPHAELRGSWPGEGFGFWIVTSPGGKTMGLGISAGCKRIPAGVPTDDPPTGSPAPEVSAS